MDSLEFDGLVFEEMISSGFDCKQPLNLDYNLYDAYCDTSGTSDFDVNTLTDDLTYVTFDDFESDQKELVESYDEAPKQDKRKTNIEGLSHEEIDLLLEHVRCPICCSTKTSKVESSSAADELNVRHCKDCGACFGADDTMDFDDLEKLLEEKKVIVKVTTRCPECSNDDVEKFRLVAINESDGQPIVECLQCYQKNTMETVTMETVAEDDVDDDWIDVDSSSTEVDSRTFDQIQPLYVCSNCEAKEEGLFEKRFDVNDRLATLKCLNCYDVQRISNQILVCPVCRNNEEKDFDVEYDENGRVVYAVCLNCTNYLELEEKRVKQRHEKDRESHECCQSDCLKPIRRKVQSLDEVKPGDHVGWFKDYITWHHAIVVATKPQSKMLTVVHYTGGLRKYNGHYASVREEDVKVDLNKDRMYVYDYGMHCHAPDDVISKARSRLGEHRYNLFARNCEHFATWCKTGVEQSGQVKAFCRRLWKTCGTALGNGLREGTVSACRGIVEGSNMKQVLGLGFQAGVDRVRSSFATSSGLGSVIKGGAVLFDVFLNLTLEVGLFVYCACRSHRKYKAGQITKPEFYREICQAGCECAGGFLGATGGGFIGQLVIPVPFLGSLIGCTLGTLIGRFLGSIAGKKFADAFIDKR